MPVTDIPIGMLNAVLKRVRRGDDPLGIGDRVTEQTDAEAENLMMLALLGMDEATQLRVATSLRALMTNSRFGRTDRASDLDEYMAPILAHLGVDPLAVAWLSRCSTGESLMVCRPDGGNTPLGMAPHRSFHDTDLPITFAFAPGFTWCTRGVLTVPNLPSTLLSACVGRPLSDLLSHPALTHAHAIISEAEMDDDDPTSTCARITLATPPVAASIDRLRDLSSAVRKAMR